MSAYKSNNFLLFLVIITDKTNILLRYLQRQASAKVGIEFLFFNLLEVCKQIKDKGVKVQPY